MADHSILFGLAIAVLIIYVASTVVYRFYFHPLAHIPGPPLAITTYLYEWYYDLYLKGQFTFHLEALHKQYGTPIIRKVSTAHKRS